MQKSFGGPEPTEGREEPSGSQELNQSRSRDLPQEERTASEDTSTEAKGAAQPQEWWHAEQPAGEWAHPSATTSATDIDVPKESTTADVYFCGHTTLLSLTRALQAIANEKLSGVLRSFWEQEPIELLAQNGEIVFATSRDPELYCPETPAVLANVDAGIVTKARAQQSETGTPFFLSLARQQSIARQPAIELVQHYGQRLFAQLWTAPRVWIMFEKSAELLSEAGDDVSGEPNVDDWALETLRFVQSLDQNVKFDPASIPAYTKDGFERIQKLKLTSDEAQFASQFNGVRSVQQIAKNLRLELKSARLTLFRFLALEIVECWPASTVATPEKKSASQRLKGLIGRGR
jgi:hypothetical protein